MKIELFNRHFILDLYRASLFIRLPYVGQAFIGGGFREMDSWRELKRVGEV